MCELIRNTEAAAWLGVSPSSVRKRQEKGALTVVWRHSRRYCRADEVRKMMNESVDGMGQFYYTAEEADAILGEPVAALWRLGILKRVVRKGTGYYSREEVDELAKRKIAGGETLAWRAVAERGGDYLVGDMTAAAMLDVALSTVQRMQWDGRLSRIKKSKVCYCRADELLRVKAEEDELNTAYYTAKDARRMLGMQPHRYWQQLRIERKDVAGIGYYRREDVDKWVEERRKEGRLSPCKVEDARDGIIRNIVAATILGRSLSFVRDLQEKGTIATVQRHGCRYCNVADVMRVKEDEDRLRADYYNTTEARAILGESPYNLWLLGHITRREVRGLGYYRKDEIEGWAKHGSKYAAPGAIYPVAAAAAAIGIPTFMLRRMVEAGEVKTDDTGGISKEDVTAVRARIQAAWYTAKGADAVLGGKSRASEAARRGLVRSKGGTNRTKLYCKDDVDSLAARGGIGGLARAKRSEGAAAKAEARAARVEARAAADAAARAEAERLRADWYTNAEACARLGGSCLPGSVKGAIEKRRARGNTTLYSKKDVDAIAEIGINEFRRRQEIDWGVDHWRGIVESAEAKMKKGERLSDYGQREYTHALMSLVKCLNQQEKYKGKTE